MRRRVDKAQLSAPGPKRPSAILAGVAGLPSGVAGIPSDNAKNKLMEEVMMTKLKVYAGAEHPHSAQKPAAREVEA